MRLSLIALAAFAVAAPLGSAWAADSTAVELVLKDHRFTPAEVRAPAGQPLRITVRNQDTTPEEFESGPLKVEKVVTGGGTITVRVRPLDPGRYPFMGEYHADTANGVLIVE